jgi:hypothetical protein
MACTDNTYFDFDGKENFIENKTINNQDKA